MNTPSFDYRQIVQGIARLQELTGRKFRVADPGTEIAAAAWEPQFEQSAGQLVCLIQTPEGVPLTTTEQGDAADLLGARRLFSLACGQLRAESSAAALQVELAEITDHLHDTYEQISVLHEVARKLTINQDDRELSASILRDLAEAIGADVTLSEPLTVSGPPNPAAPDRRFLIKRAAAASQRQSAEHLLSMLLEVRGTQRWLSARRSSSEPEFGSGEGLILRSVATMLETHLCNAELYREKDALLLGFVRSLVVTLDARDHFTCGHSERVAELGELLARQLELPAEECEEIFRAGLLHDLGKIGIPDHILRKAGALTTVERQLIQQHPQIGYEIIREIPAFQNLLPGVRSHHEAWDGRGYPDGLAGDQIPLMARILAVADAFDAITSDRPYRQGRGFDEVKQVLLEGAGQQWCPTVISAFAEAEEQFREHLRRRQPPEITAIA